MPCKGRVDRMADERMSIPYEERVRPAGLQVWGSVPEACVVLYLGYSLRLSPSERRLLWCLWRWREEAGDLRPTVTTEELRSVVAGDGDKPCSAAQVSVLVGRINRKAQAIGGRRLILGRSHHGFALHPSP